MQKHDKHKIYKTQMIHKSRTALRCFTGRLKLVSRGANLTLSSKCHIVGNLMPWLICYFSEVVLVLENFIKNISEFVNMYICICLNLAIIHSSNVTRQNSIHKQNMSQKESKDQLHDTVRKTHYNRDKQRHMECSKNAM